MPTVDELRAMGAHEAADAIENLTKLAQDVSEHGIFIPIEDSPETQHLIELRRLSVLASDLADRRDWEGASIVEKQIEALRAAKQPKIEEKALRSPHDIAPDVHEDLTLLQTMANAPASQKQSFLNKLDRIRHDRQRGQRPAEPDAGPVSPKTYVIDWFTVPSWANYHVFDETFDPIGEPTGMFFSHRPRIYHDKSFWEMSEHTHDGHDLRSAPSKLVKPDNLDWKLSLLRRPDVIL